MKDAMPPSTSGSRAGSSRGAEGAAGRPDISDGEAGVRTGIVQGTVRGPDVLASYSRRRVGHPPGICSRGCKTRERVRTTHKLLALEPLPVTAPR